MNNEPFHVIGQEWRYSSKSKSLANTLHLGQLPTGTIGQTVLIDATSPASGNTGNNGFSVPGLQQPMQPGIGVENVTFSRTTLPKCFGSVGMNKTILAAKNMIIQFAGWTDQLMELYMIPQESGKFLFHAEAQSDFRDINYLGPIDPSTGARQQRIVVAVSRNPISSSLGGAISQKSMQGIFDATHWSTSFYISTRHTARCWGTVIVAAGGVISFRALWPGVYPDGFLSAWMFKYAEV